MYDDETIKELDMKESKKDSVIAMMSKSQSQVAK